jgi:hypothetical protein
MFQSVLEQAESAAELFERRSLVVHLDPLCVPKTQPTGRVCTENLIRIDCATESPKRQWR